MQPKIPVESPAVRPWGWCSGSWLGSEAPRGVGGKEEKRADVFKAWGEMVPCVLSSLLGLVYVCWPDPADPKAQVNWSQHSLV